MLSLPPTDLIPKTAGTPTQEPVLFERRPFKTEDYVHWGLGPVPPHLMPVVEHCYYNHVGVLTTGELDTLARQHGATVEQVIAESPGWFKESGVPGVWSFAEPGANSASDLAAYCHANPDAGVYMAGWSVPRCLQWASRGSKADWVSLPPKMPVPDVFRNEHTRVVRWVPKAPTWLIRGIPAWSPDTVLTFMAARPHQYDWDEIADHLIEVSDTATVSGLRAELADQPRGVWMNVCVILDYYCERKDLADELFAVAPEGRGFHWLGTVGQNSYWVPRWHRRYQVVDHVMTGNWWPSWK